MTLRWRQTLHQMSDLIASVESVDVRCHPLWEGKITADLRDRTLSRKGMKRFPMSVNKSKLMRTAGASEVACGYHGHLEYVSWG